jgi:succinoglycan biosynthesis protein ExoL
VIGYFGLIRGDATIELIRRVAERLGDRVRFRFRGVLTTVGKQRFDAILRRCPNISFGGAYANPRDLAELYGGVDFAWAIDLEHAEHNSRWLLPCRFYEAGFFGVPCIAVRDFEIGRLIDQLGVGWTFSEPLEDALVHFFETLTPEAYNERRCRLEAAPRDRFVAGGEMADLCARLALNGPQRPSMAIGH